MKLRASVGDSLDFIGSDEFRDLKVAQACSSHRSNETMKIFYYQTPSDNLAHLRNLAACFGVSSELVSVGNGKSPADVVEEFISSEDAGAVLDSESLSHCSSRAELEKIANSLSSRTKTLLLVVNRINEATNQILETLTHGVVQGAQFATGLKKITFLKQATKWNQELSGHSYVRGKSEGLTLSASSRNGADLIMELEGSPSFVHVPFGKAKLFIWSTLEIMDVSRPLAKELEFEVATDEYIPVIIFLRSAFGAQCWHNPRPGAGLVIDDPLLRKSYGFIKFPRLLESARKHKYHITLAFIPWNHWRSRAKEAQMFLKYSDCFSVCAHGCDHTKNEYRSTDYDALLRKNFVARERMERHGGRTGLRSEPLMACPQEQYSLEAMCAFADSRQFIGLICTACMPRNLPAPQLRGADLLLPAQDSFYGFPVFKRHYWNGMAVFAMALFLGKPAILVEHHEFFRNGSAGAEEFAQRLAELRPDLKWKSLAETVTRTHARRRVSTSKEEVRFFTDTFYLEHELEQPAEFRLLRRLPEATAVERVLVAGKEVPFARENGFLTFEAHAQRPQTLSIQVAVAPIKPTKAYSFGVKYQASVALRRGLSELRDNVIARNRFAARVGSRLMKFLRKTAC